ncbi:MAG: transglutaminase-like domain-containing protein [Armatimonadetes bacterium]|nr:transglutaminase-like domain-containing protein [Armatimonadota bacterium]MCX7967661.1 transglutaminase-like domain-containing protein [Armatimonadota bacterium]MDW8143666.1 transglutaminase-like domain-containing protein [Armatimonadota bacterium]
MRQPFWIIYLAAALLLLIAFWVVGLATESFSFATTCYIWSVVGLLAAYLQSHSNLSALRGIGALLWLGGLVGVMGSVGSSWQASVAAGASGDLAWLMIIAIVAVIVVYLVGRWWGEFYAALSFIIVPVLSIFGLSIPMIASIEIVFAIIASLVIGVFLVSIESLLIRWHRGQLGDVTPGMLLSYCWRLSIAGSATVLTIGLLLVPPATLIQGPLSQQLLRLPVLPFARFSYSGVEFPDLFTMPGGPIALPDIELFRVRGTDYPRWRVRTYVHYVGSGWRISNEVEDPQLPELRMSEKFLEMVWRRENRFSSPTVRAAVAGRGYRIFALLSPGEALRLQVSPLSKTVVLKTKSGCLQPTGPLRISAYNITAVPIPENLPPENSASLTPEERRVFSYFPPYLYRIRELAEQVTRGAETPYEKAKALETFLRTQYRYSDSPPYLVGRNVDVVTFFLFEAKEGACDWFASALALMCRAVGIPTRVVTGFYSDEVDTDGSLIIRANDAHAWVEAFIDGHGWVTLDATPSGDRNRFDLWHAFQRWLSRRYRASFASPHVIWWFVVALWVLGAVPTMLKLSWHVWEQYRPRPRWQSIVHFYLTAVQVGRKANLKLHPNATPWENAEACNQTPRFPLLGKKAFRELADLTVAVIYAGEEPTRAMVKKAKRLLKVFHRQTRLYKRWFAPQQVKRISLQTLRQIWERL